MGWDGGRRDEAAGEVRHAGLGQDDGAGGLELADDGGVGGRDVVFGDDGAVGRDESGGLGLVFQQDGDAVEGAAVFFRGLVVLI